jgi:UDP-2,3-diacylglucosamine hydrolase
VSTQSLFIADLHLDPASKRTINLALRFVHEAQSASHLYILGDLFEYWLGDDGGLSLYAPFIQALRELSNTGCAITLMHGNRDFLLGDSFAEQTGTTLVKGDELIIHLNDEPVLLMHGDTLCTDDKNYQRFRTLVRDPQWQSDFLSLSIDERTQQAQQMRTASKGATAGKPSAIMDVNLEMVARRMDTNQCQTLIHGHTHRPAVHELANAQRWVVGDWHPGHARYVRFDGEQLALKDFH